MPSARTDWLPAFLASYNAGRPHSAPGYKPPASRLGGNNRSQLKKLVGVRMVIAVVRDISHRNGCAGIGAPPKTDNVNSACRCWRG